MAAAFNFLHMVPVLWSSVLSGRWACYIPKEWTECWRAGTQWGLWKTGSHWGWGTVYKSVTCVAAGQGRNALHVCIFVVLWLKFWIEKHWFLLSACCHAARISPCLPGLTSLWGRASDGDHCPVRNSSVCFPAVWTGHAPLRRHTSSPGPQMHHQTTLFSLCVSLSHQGESTGSLQFTLHRHVRPQAWGVFLISIQ